MSHSIVSFQQQQLFETFVCQPVSAWCADQLLITKVFLPA